ncbi:MAG: PqqD family protein [Firmicutes bacterium]|nr:PqqD family protein [Bacillota bacterium]
MKGLRKMKKENFLDFVVVKSEDVDWKELDNGIIQIIIWRNSLLDKIVRKFFNTPEKTKIDLDKTGSFIWKCIDGKRDIYEISKLVKDEFGKKAEPLNKRLITYINILRNNKFIKLINKQEEIRC